MKLLHSSPFHRRHILALTFLALALASPASAVVLPVDEDTGSGTANTLTRSAGSATSVKVNATSQAFIRFNVYGLGLPTSGAVAAARLKLYFPAVTTPADVTVHKITSEWSESVAGPEPTFDSSPVATVLGELVIKKTFVLVDVTQTVRNWVAGADGDFGFALATAAGKLTVGAKEGSGTGYPAELEIDLAPDNASINGAMITSGAIDIGHFTTSLVNQLNGKLDETGGTITGTTSFDFGASVPRLNIQLDGGIVPVLDLVGGTNAGVLRLRNNLQIWPNDAATSAGSFDVRGTDGGTKVILEGSGAPNGTGGMLRLRNGSEMDFGATPRQALNLFTDGTRGLGIQDNTEYFRSPGGFAWFKGGVHTNTDFMAGSGGTTVMTLNATTGTLSVANLSAAGTITATNLPAAKTSVMPPRDPRVATDDLNLGAGGSTDLDSLSVTVPSAGGFLLFTATANVGTSDDDLFLKLEETTSGAPVQLVEVRSNGNSTMTLSWTVSSPTTGNHSYKTSLYNSGTISTPVDTTTLTIVFIPKSL